MKTYLVGGAVRDSLLGRPVKERDWLVTGVSAKELLRQGFQQVGREFPVFLHPQTHEEHALPRRGRTADDGTPVTLAEDLERRDLTINAMAIAPDGCLIDPMGGKQDLSDRVLRHTPFFREDPIRVLRLARFAARYRSTGFRIASETLDLARRVVREGDLEHATPERVFAEIRKGLSENDPVAFFEVMRDLGALAVILPEVDRLFGVPQPEQHHPEIDTGLHSLMVLQQACHLSTLPEVRFAALLHDVGKGTTPRAEWPRHIAHEARGAHLVRSLGARLCLPRRWTELAELAARYHLQCHRVFEMRPATILKTLSALDAFRRKKRFDQFLIVCEADMRGRRGFGNRPYTQKAFFAGAFRAAMNTDLRGISRDGHQNKKIAERIARARTAAIANYRDTFLRNADSSHAEDRSVPAGK